MKSEMKSCWIWNSFSDDLDIQTDIKKYISMLRVCKVSYMGISFLETITGDVIVCNLM